MLNEEIHKTRLGESMPKHQPFCGRMPRSQPFCGAPRLDKWDTYLGFLLSVKLLQRGMRISRLKAPEAAPELGAPMPTVKTAREAPKSPGVQTWVVSHE